MLGIASAGLGVLFNCPPRLTLAVFPCARAGGAPRGQDIGLPLPAARRCGFPFRGAEPDSDPGLPGQAKRRLRVEAIFLKNLLLRRR
jgi:hypothetical protein